MTSETIQKKDLFQILETENLILKKITIEDAPDLLESVFSHYEWVQYYYQLPFSSYEDYVALVSKYQTYYENENHFRWGIYLKRLFY